MSRRHAQAGFSLIEMLIGMAITAVAVTAAVLLLTKFARTAGAYGEVSTLEEVRGSTESLLRADFDGAGYNLTRASQPGAGKENAQFITNPDFDTSTPGSLSKLTNNASYPNAYAYSARAVSSGVGIWSWAYSNICKGCWAYVAGKDGNIDAIGYYYDENNSNSITIYESQSPSGTVASNYGSGVSIAGPQPGDVYQISVEAPNAQQTVRFVRYYRIRSGVRTILYTSGYPVPPYPLYFLAYQPNAGSGMSNISVIAAPIINRVNNQTEFARLPFDGGTQLTSPITTTGSSVTILSGDKSTDVAPGLTTFSSNSTQIDIKTPPRGSYANGDVVMLVDYGNTDPANPVSPASAVCVVSAVSNPDSVTTRLTLTKARQTNPAWGRLWSSDTDHAHTFSPAQTSVIKLAPPVTYALSTDGRLVRIEGARVSTVSFNARAASCTQTGSSPTQAFTVTVVLAAEGVETAAGSSTESRSTIEFVATPRAMNLASNQLN